MAVNKNNAEQNQVVEDKGTDNANQPAGDDTNKGNVDNGNGGAQNEQGNGSSDGNQNGSGADNGDSSNGGKTFTQDDVNRMMTREKKQGRNSVYNELGIDPSDTDSIELIKSIMSAKKQSTTGGDDAGAVSQANDEKVAELEHRAKVAEAKAEAMMLGVKPQFVDDVVTLAAAHLAEQGEGAEFKTVIGELNKTVIGELKSKYPLWFGEDEDDKNAAGKSGTGSSINPDSGSNGSKKDEGIGKRLAAQRKPSGNGKKFSYWGKNN